MDRVGRYSDKTPTYGQVRATLRYQADTWTWAILRYNPNIWTWAILRYQPNTWREVGDTQILRKRTISLHPTEYSLMGLGLGMGYIIDR